MSLVIVSQAETLLIPQFLAIMHLSLMGNTVGWSTFIYNFFVVEKKEESHSCPQNSLRCNNCMRVCVCVCL